MALCDMFAVQIVLDAIVLAALVWVGTYIGSRWTPLQQRTSSYRWALALLYLLVGVAVTSLGEYAQRLRGPYDNWSVSYLDFLPPRFAGAGFLLGMLLVSIFTARGVAALCHRRPGRDA